MWATASELEDVSLPSQTEAHLTVTLEREGVRQESHFRSELYGGCITVRQAFLGSVPEKDFQQKVTSTAADSVQTPLFSLSLDFGEKVASGD